MRQGRVAYVTEFFDEPIVRLAVAGCCHHFAAAVHRRTGLPFGVAWRRDEGLTSLPLHVWCRTPSGDVLDAEGVRKEEAMLALYAAGGRVEVEAYATEDEVTEALDRDRYLVMHERGIDGAERVVAGSPAFLDLLAGYGKSPAPTR